jgi:predicted esterase
MAGETAADLGFVHRFLPGDTSALPTLLLLHGTGGDENDLLPVGAMLAPGAALLSPRGKVLENGAPRWFRRLREGVFDEQDVVARAAELAGFVGDAVAAYDLDPTRLVAVGFSNGANIAAALHLLHPEVLSGSVLLRAMVPLTPPAPPDLSGVPILLSAGRYDAMIPPENVTRLATMLRSAGADVTLSWEPQAHNLVPHEIEVAREWLAERGDARKPGR